MFIFLFIILIALFYFILIILNRDSLYEYWNGFISSDCDFQDTTDKAKNIPSLQSAWICQNEDIRSLQLGIFLSHDYILTKVQEYFRTLESISIENKEIGIRYFPLYSKGIKTTLVDVFGLSDMYLKTINLGLLILEPGTKTSWLKGKSRGIYRYHYPLKLSEDCGLYIKIEKTYHIRWNEKQGIILDPTLEHKLENQGNTPCFLFIADIPRFLSWKYNFFNGLIHSYFPPEEIDFSH